MCLAISIYHYVGFGVGANVSNVGTGDSEGWAVVGPGVGRIVGGDEGRGVGLAVRNSSSVAAPHSGPQLPGPCLSGYTEPHCVALMRRCGASACGVPIMLPRIVKTLDGSKSAHQDLMEFSFASREKKRAAPYKSPLLFASGSPRNLTQK